MTYIIQSDIEAVIGAARVAAMTDDTAGTTANATVLAAAIAQGEAEVLGAIAGRYTVPAAAAAPEALKELFVRAAAVRLARRRPDSYSEYDKLMGDELRKELEEIRAGKREVYGLAARSGGAGTVRPARSDDEEPAYGERSDGVVGIEEF